MFFTAIAVDGLSLIFILQNAVAPTGHDGPFSFTFSFQNKSILIKSNLINKMTSQVTQQINTNQFGFRYQFEMQTLT